MIITYIKLVNECLLCKYCWTYEYEEPCNKCKNNSMFVPIKDCQNCKHRNKNIYDYPCSTCGDYNWNFEYKNK